ncbi:MAG: DNA polymerase IV [Candidatus Omnitrophica bacterium]|nr:DNA polymerase IV [Candidatus Omnitrophota bacterium]
MSKVILHLDMDAFFASVEQQANPKLKNKPLIVGSRTDRRRTVVAACSYEAKAFGIESGMSSQEAFRLCPQAIFVPCDSTKYIYTAQEISKMLKDFSPQIEMSSIDEFYLDITGCERIFGSPKALGRLIKQKIKERFGITGSIGIAPNKSMAKLASKEKKPDGLVIWAKKDLPGILKDMPIEKICGIGPKMTLYLQQMSIFSCGQLANTSIRLLAERFGKYGLWLKEIARGEDTDRVELSATPELPPKSVGHSYTLEKNIFNIEAIKAWIRLLCEMVATRLRNLLLEGSVVHLYLRGPNLQWWSRQKKFAESTLDGQSIYKRCLIIMDNLAQPRNPIRALGVTVSGLVPARSIYLFDEDKKRDSLLSAIDDINQRFGEWSIYPARLTSINSK